MRFSVAALLAFTVAAPAYSAVIPREAPDISVKLPDGRAVKPSQYKGKVVVLEFLLTGCPHCQKASQTLEKLYKEFGPKGLQALGGAINDDAYREVVPYVKKFSLTYPVGVTQRDHAIVFLQHPIMQSLLMPQVVFIDRKGTIRAQHTGGDSFFQNEEKNMREMILKLLNEGAAKPAAKPAKKKGTS